MAKENTSEEFEEELLYTTEVKYNNYKLEWTIDDFESVCREIKVIESTRFPIKKSSQGQWFIRFEPDQLKENSALTLKFALKCTDDVARYISGHISLVNTLKQSNLYTETSHLQKFNDSVSWYVSSHTLHQNLDCDSLFPINVKVIFKLRVFDSVNNVFENPATDSAKFEGVIEQMEKFFIKSELTDIIFTVEEEEFRAHKAILALRCPAFAEILKLQINEDEEEWTSVIKIENLSSKIFEKMLRFIYSDKVENLEEFAIDMFHAAEKYQLEKLKIMCINCLCKNVSMNTVIKTLELADIFSISNLKDKSLRFLVLNLPKIKGTAEFIQLLKDRPHLSIEIVEMKNEDNIEHEETDESSENTIYEFR